MPGAGRVSRGNEALVGIATPHVVSIRSIPATWQHWVESSHGFLCVQRINENHGRQVGWVGRRCSAAEAARQHSPTVHPVIDF